MEEQEEEQVEVRLVLPVDLIEKLLYLSDTQDVEVDQLVVEMLNERIAKVEKGADERAMALTKTLANMTLHGEEDEFTDEPFELSNEDAHHTLNAVIENARNIVYVPAEEAS